MTRIPSGDWVEIENPVRESMEAKAYWGTGEWSNFAGIKEVQSKSSGSVEEEGLQPFSNSWITKLARSDRFISLVCTPS